MYNVYWCLKDKHQRDYLVEHKRIKQWPQGSKTMVSLVHAINKIMSINQKLGKKIIFAIKHHFWIISSFYRASKPFFSDSPHFFTSIWLFWKSWYVKIDPKNIFFQFSSLQQQPTWTSPLLKSLAVSKISCALTTAPKIHSAYIKVTVTLHQPIAASAGVQNLNLIASMQLSLPKSS